MIDPFVGSFCSVFVRALAYSVSCDVVGENGDPTVGSRVRVRRRKPQRLGQSPSRDLPRLFSRVEADAEQLWEL